MCTHPVPAPAPCAIPSDLLCRDAGDGGTTVPGLPVPEKYSQVYQSVPQKGLNGRSTTVQIGSVVGGGTVVNAMFFNRGSKLDYDSWVKLGNPGWGWGDLLPYFKKVGMPRWTILAAVGIGLTV